MPIGTEHAPVRRRDPYTPEQACSGVADLLWAAVAVMLAESHYPCDNGTDRQACSRATDQRNDTPSA